MRKLIQVTCIKCPFAATCDGQTCQRVLAESATSEASEPVDEPD